jgi:hypothetical protein
LVQLLDEQPAGTDAPIRACVVGAMKVGKSRLLNAVVGHPLLSPVRADITTSCWLEVGYGESTTAEVAMADPDPPAHPVSRWRGLGDVERYVALGRSQEPVLAVKVRLPEPALGNLLIVDTPGSADWCTGTRRPHSPRCARPTPCSSSATPGSPSSSPSWTSCSRPRGACPPSSSP